jgi:hypothetical protein
MHYDLDKNKNVINTTKPAKRTKRWIVSQTEINGSFVSTVFLGINHGLFGRPKWFETMIFAVGKYEDFYCERYATYEEARAGHDFICNQMQNPESEIFQEVTIRNNASINETEQGEDQE